MKKSVRPPLSAADFGTTENEVQGHRKSFLALHRKRGLGRNSSRGVAIFIFVSFFFFKNRFVLKISAVLPYSFSDL